MPLPPLKPEEILRALQAYSKCRLSRNFTMKILGIDDPRVLNEIMEDANLPLPTVTILYARQAENWYPELSNSND